ncbi:hypothetical protein LINPERHAP2_LOCUS40937 [Linum perenne]
MGTEETWVRSSDEEEESLSLSDLPVDLLPEESIHEEENRNLPNSEDFDFGRVLSGRGSIGSKSANSEMCAADDIFFKGQILPFRSESMDRSSSLGFASFSSRSSSSNSHYSSSSASCSATSKNSAASAGGGSGGRRTRVLNRFNTYPSPKPQVIKTHHVAPPPARSKSSIWGNLRLGLVRAPGIEFQPDLKSRSSINAKTEKQSNGKIPAAAESKRNSSSATTTTTGRLLLSGCDCGIGGAIQPAAITKEKQLIKDSGEAAASEEKGKQREKKEGKGKEETSRHRTVEWIIKELSHGSFVEERRNSISSSS